MKRQLTFAQSPLLWRLLMALIFLSIVGCNATSTTDTSGGDMSEPMGDNHDMGDMEESGHDEGSNHDEAARQFVPNNGAAVRIISPAEGDAFSLDDSIPVIIEPTNFTIGEEGNHWHIYLDGSPIMVMGGETFVLKGLAPGGHEIDVYLSLGTHEDLEEGDKITIMVEE